MPPLKHALCAAALAAAATLAAAAETTIIYVNAAATEPCKLGYTHGCVVCTPCVARTLIERHAASSRGAARSSSSIWGT